MENNKVSEHRKSMRELDWQIRSNRPLIAICSHEEKESLMQLNSLLKEAKKSGQFFNGI